MSVRIASTAAALPAAAPTIKRPSDVRIAVKVGGSRSDGSTRGLNDWLGQPRQWTPWVARVSP